MPSGYIGKKKYNCINCNFEKDWSWRNTQNKYCSNKCHQDYRYKTITLPRILEGKLSLKTHRDAILKFIIARDSYKCSKCNLTDWCGEQMILDIDHIDGNNENNLPSNWRLLCPNCHRMTPTWGNKKRI